MEAAGGKSQRKFGGVTRCGTQSREATSPTLSGNGRQVPDGVNGREAASRQIFLHVEGPDGLIFSYVNGMAELDDKPRLARQFPGSKPDFDESFRNYREQMVRAFDVDDHAMSLAAAAGHAAGADDADDDRANNDGHGGSGFARQLSGCLIGQVYWSCAAQSNVIRHAPDRLTRSSSFRRKSPSAEP